MQYFPLLLLLFLSISSIQINAQNSIREGSDYALFFVVDDFNHWHAFPAKSTQQIRDIETELQTAYGFKTMFLHNPTRKEILDTLIAYQKKNFQKDDQLLIYFSMHGHYEEGGTGALIPKNGLASDPAYDTWIRHPLLEDLVNQIPCEHILLSIDACYSGTFGGDKGKPVQPPYATKDDCASKAAKAMEHKSRLYFTSGGVERTPTDSHFADKWLEALRVRNTDGVLFYYELFGVLNEAYPLPRNGEFRGHDIGGEFVFVHKEICNPIPSLSDEQHWQTVLDNPEQKMLLEHLHSFPYCQHENDIIALLSKPEKEPQSKKDTTVKSPPDDMVFIKGGTFTMGNMK